MASIKYYLTGKGERHNINARIIVGRTTDIRISLGLQIEPNYWSVKKQMPSQKAASTEKLNLTTELKELRRKMLKAIEGAIIKSEPITAKWLRNIIDIHRGKATAETSNYLTDQIEYYQTYLKTRVKNGKIGATKGSIRNFDTTKERILKFEEYKKVKLLLLQIDLTFHSDYVKFATKQLALSTNSIGSDIKRIKTVCLDAQDRNFIINNQIISRKFSAPSEKTLFITLNENELKLIKGFKGADYLENARDWLLIGCWTGCRIGDLMELTNKNLHTNIDGLKFIRYTQSKTGKTVDVLMHPDVLEIVEANGSFPRKISDQKLNDYIKLVAKEAGITNEVEGAKFDKKTKRKKKGIYPKWELITSHVCRRSFATNQYEKIPNKLIMAVTGHTTETMLLNYIGEIANDHLEDFAALWAKKPLEDKVKPIKANSNE